MSLIQDFRNWKTAKKATEIAQFKKDVQFNQMLGRIPIAHYGHNVFAEAAFIKCAPDPKNKPQECKQYMNNYAHICHAYPCFYVMYNPFGITGIMTRDKVYQEKQVQRCMNNREDGKIYEAFCHGCPAFEDLVKYQSLYAQFKIAQEKQQEAKQKFLNNFIFWGQNGR
jgi:hypothetical protein